MDDPVARLRTLCLALPETSERVSHGEPCFFVRDKTMFVMVDDHHHKADHVGFWCAAPDGVQQELVEAEPERFFRPPYVGHRGWLGVRFVPGATDWDEVEAIVRDAYRQVAPRPLVAALDTAGDAAGDA